MKNESWYSRRPDKQRCGAWMARLAAGFGVAALLMTGTAVAQTATPGAGVPTPAEMSVPEGYTARHSVDLGGRVTNNSGSAAMYDTLVNMHSGPRVLGETFEMHALPGKKNAPVDYLKAFGSGFGGDPYVFAKLDVYKTRYFDFTGLFRRDRQYFDYDLLGNPNIVPGNSIPIGPANAPVDSLAWPQVNQSPLLFNTVRRMLDTDLTLFPQAKVTYRIAYSRNNFEGPTLSPSYPLFKYDGLVREYQRNAADDYLVGVDWKPVERTTVTLQQIVNRNKIDSSYMLNPNGFMVQESDGTPAYLGNWDSQTPYGLGACNTNSMTNYTDPKSATILSPAQSLNGRPVIDAACAVVTSYTRSQPTRITIPTWFLRFQSSSISNLTMTGDFRYTLGNISLPSFYENVQGLNGTMRSETFSGYAKAHRQMLSADYGAVWQATNAVSLADQVDFFNSAEPGYSDVPVPVALFDPATAGNETVNYNGTLGTGTGSLPHGINGRLTGNYFGMEFLTNDLTARWDASPRTTLSLTYRYGNRKIGQGAQHKGPIAVKDTDPTSGTVEINENGGIFGAGFRPKTNWNVNATVEGLFYDNVFTPIAPRREWHYRLHTMYKPTPWATVSGSYDDIERSNNTNNNQEDVAAGAIPYEGPIDHVEHTRGFGLGAILSPNDAFSLDLTYDYMDVYTATNVCFASGASATLPGTATLTGAGGPNVCPGIYARGSNTILIDWFARDFIDAPTNSGSAAMIYKPTGQVQTEVGYRINSVNGSRFFNDAREVNGSLVSNYQTPFLNFAYTSRPGLTWKAEYNYFGYTEGGASGPQYCSTSTSFSAQVVPCTSLAYPTGLTEAPSGLTQARNFRANNLTVGVHYEF